MPSIITSFMFRVTMPLEDTWEHVLSKEFMVRRPQGKLSTKDLTDKIAHFVSDEYSINAYNLFVRGGFREKEDIDRIAETGWDYQERDVCFEKNATYVGKFHNMPYIHLVEDPFLNPLMHLCLHFNKSPGLVLYDPEQMVKGKDERWHEFGEYHFANPEDRKSAVVGIIEFSVQESRDARLMRVLLGAK